MKYPSFSAALLPCLLSTALYVATPCLSSARDTNEVKQSDSGKRGFFEFQGGNPIDFVHAMDRHFRTRLIQILSLPETLRGAEVPKLRVAASEPREVLALYNRLDNPELGQWRYEPEAGAESTNLGVLTLVPDKTVAAATIKHNTTRVQAMALADIPTNKWDSLAQSIKRATDLGATVGQTGVHGNFYLQPESKILIVAGPEAYIETLSSVVAAYRDNAQLEKTATENQSTNSKPAP
jgi:hypothetical protein